MKRHFWMWTGLCGILALNAADGDKAFEYDFGKPLQTAPAVDNDGTIYVGGNGAVSAVTPAGVEIWKTELSTGSEAKVGGITIGADRVYVTSEEGLFALNKTGAKLWTNQVNTASSMVALDLEGNLYVGTEDLQLLSLTPAGSTRWSEAFAANTSDPLPPPAVGLEGRVYIRVGDGALSVRESATGHEVFTKWVTSGPLVPLAFLENGNLLVNEYGMFFRVVGADGESKWTTDTLFYTDTSPVVSPAGQIYATGAPIVLPEMGQFSAFTEEGDLAWNYPVAGYSVPVLADDGTIFTAGQGKIVALTPAGMLKWEYQNNAEVVQALSLGVDGTVLAAEATGRLLGLEGSSPLAYPGWPTLGGDARHTFNKRNPVLIGEVAVSNVSDSEATFAVEVNPAGRATAVYFEVSAGLTITQSEAEAITGGTGPVAVMLTVTNLQAGTPYAVRAVTSNSLEVVRSPAAHFQTEGTSVEVPPTLQALQTFAATGGTLTFSEPGTIFIPERIEITADITIDANGHTVVLSGSGISPLLELSSGAELTLKGLVLVDGKAEGFQAEEGGHPGRGGAIVNNGGNLALIDCTLSNNVAMGAKGSISGNAAVAANAAGGAIWQSAGSLLVENSRFINNTAKGGSGYTVNDVGTAAGGALAIEGGSLQLRDSTLEQNIATAGRSGQYFVGGGPAKGGGLYFSGTSALMENATVVSNSCAGSLYYSGPANAQGGAVFNAGSMVLTNVLLSQNAIVGGAVGARGSGRGSHAYGGAVLNEGFLRVYATAFLSNYSLGGYSIDRSSIGAGGAIYNRGSLEALNNTYASNKAASKLSRFPQDIEVAGVGSALYNVGTAGFTNITVFGNLNSQFAISGTNEIALKNSLLGPNEGYDDFLPVPGQNADQNVVDAGHNLSSDNTPTPAGAGSLHNVDPKLGPLGYYGGSTPVYPLMAGSPAIDAADDAAAPETDQRGRTRPHGAHADIGAFESSPPFYVWGYVRGPHDSSTRLTFGTNEVSPDASGYFDLGTLPEGITEISVTATNTVFRPNPWPLNATVDGPVYELFGFELHKFVFDEGYEEPVFTLAGEEEESFLIEGSTDLEAWSPVGTYTVNESGLISVPVTNSARLFLRTTPQ